MVIEFILPREWPNTTRAAGYLTPKPIAPTFCNMSSVVMTHKILPAVEGLPDAAGCATSKDENTEVVRTLYRTECVDGRCIRPGR
jgi:hypothetical protein